jgi:hypothetical protein
MSSEDFKSLIVTDPDLIDEGIDVSGLRTQTDTNPRLLGAIEDYPGISYDPTAYSYLSDLNRLFASGLPTIDTSQPTTPAPPSGGGGGGGGTTPTQPDSIGGFDPGVTPGPSGFIGLDPEYDLDPKDYVDDPTYSPFTTTSPQEGFLASGAAGGANLPSTSDPFLASGAAGGANLPTDTGIMVQDLTQPSNVGDFQITGASPLENQTGIIDNAVDPQPVRTILGPDGITYDAVTGQPIYEDLDAQAAATDLALGTQDLVTEQDLADNTSLLQKLGLPADFDIKRAALEAGINLAVGVPITLIGKALGAVLPSGIQNTTKVARETGLLTGDNTVTQDIYGINTQSQFGNYDQYNIEQVDKLENVLDDLKNNKYKDDEQAYLDNTKRMRKELEDREKYLDAKGLTGVGDVDSGRGSGLRPTADDDKGDDMLDTTPTSTFVAEKEDEIYEPPAPPSPPTGTNRPGGDNRDDSPAPSQPDYSNVSTGGPPSQGGGGGGPPSQGGGCCFIMLESRYGDGTMDKVVRRYRDEKMTPRNRRGYYKVARVLVPLMRKSKVFKWIVAKTFADPLVSYGKWYYGENKHGWIFAPIKTAWLKIFDVVGTDTVFIRENGEEV